MTKEKTTFKIGDIVSINHGATYTQRIGKITNINRLAHPYRSDDKLFTWYRIEYRKYVDGVQLPNTTDILHTCDTSILEHFDIDEYIDLIMKQNSVI